MDRTAGRDTRFRIEMTVSCRDTDALPKVEQAGRIVTENGEQVQIMHNGLRVQAGGYFGDWMSEIIERLHGHHEPQEELVFDEILRHVGEDATMFELGAFWSYYSIWFAAGHPSRRAFAIEPDPSSLAIGRRNAELNDVRLEFLQACVGGESIEALDFDSDFGGRVTVPQVTVPELMQRFGLDHLDVLHCDAQGAELGVLTAAADLLRAGAIGFVVVSTHSHYISGDPLTHQRCLALLGELGGRILIEHDVHESFSGDGMIVATFRDVDWPELAMSRNRYSTSLFRNPLFDLDDEMSSRRAREAAEALVAAPVEPPPVEAPPAAPTEGVARTAGTRLTARRLLGRARRVAVSGTRGGVRLARSAVRRARG